MRGRLLDSALWSRLSRSDSVAAELTINTFGASINRRKIIVRWPCGSFHRQNPRKASKYVRVDLLQPTIQHQIHLGIVCANKGKPKLLRWCSIYWALARRTRRSGKAWVEVTADVGLRSRRHVAAAEMLLYSDLAGESVDEHVLAR